MSVWLRVFSSDRSFRLVVSAQAEFLTAENTRKHYFNAWIQRYLFANQITVHVSLSQ